MTRSQIRRMQRYSLWATVVALLCLLVLHNPSGGYTTAVSHYDPWPLPATAAEEVAESACPPPTAAERDVLESQKKYLGRELGHCRRVALDFFEWRSDGALLAYVATVRKALVIGGAILLAGLGWVWVLGDPKIQREATPSPGNISSRRGRRLT